MRKSNIPLMKVACILLLTTVAILGFSKGEKSNNSSSTNVDYSNQIKQIESEDIKLVESIVSNFGQRLKMVSVLATEDIVIKDIERYYSQFISTELLEKWKESPQSIPGRYTSSPWPDRIEIFNVRRISENEYEVKGEIVEVTSSGMSSEEAVSKIPLILKVTKNGEKWAIDDVVIDENSIYGK